MVFWRVRQRGLHPAKRFLRQILFPRTAGSFPSHGGRRPYMTLLRHAGRVQVVPKSVTLVFIWMRGDDHRRWEELDMATHREVILGQFSRQALPFSAAAMISDKGALNMIVDAVQPSPKDIVLDVACGPGLVVCAFAPYAGRVIGIDMTPAMLDRARLLAAEQGVRNVDWHQGDIYSLPYAAESFTTVVTRYSFHHLIDPAAALREMARVCAAKGRIVVVDAYAPEDYQQAAEFNRVERLRDPSHVRSLSLSALLDLFARVGLPEPRTTLYELRVEVRDLLARAFPNPGDEIEIVKTFRASAADGRLGIPVHLDGDNVHVTYRAAILTTQPVVKPVRRNI